MSVDTHLTADQLDRLTEAARVANWMEAGRAFLTERGGHQIQGDLFVSDDGEVVNFCAMGAGYAGAALAQTAPDELFTILLDDETLDSDERQDAVFRRVQERYQRRYGTGITTDNDRVDAMMPIEAIIARVRALDEEAP